MSRSPGLPSRRFVPWSRPQNAHLPSASGDGSAPDDSAGEIRAPGDYVPTLPRRTADNPAVSTTIAATISGQYPPITDSRSAAASCGPRIRLTSFATATATSRTTVTAMRNEKKIRVRTCPIRPARVARAWHRHPGRRRDSARRAGQLATGVLLDVARVSRGEVRLLEQPHPHRRVGGWRVRRRFGVRPAVAAIVWGRDSRHHAGDEESRDDQALEDRNG